MDYIILGGDERFACLARLLERQGNDVLRLRQWGEGEAALATAKNVVLNYPLKLGDGPDFGGLLDRVSPDATLWLCGPGEPEAAPEGRDIVNLWKDEELIRDNAALTAEGALSAAMAVSRRSLKSLPTLVIGWGRIGRALTELLVALGVDTAAASRRESHRNQAVERGAQAADTSAIADALPGRKLIFNTAPGMVLDDGALASVDGDALLVDLASPPYGIDLSAAWARGLRAWREPGLPGRYCPESAAEALLRAMKRGRDGR